MARTVCNPKPTFNCDALSDRNLAEVIERRRSVGQHYVAQLASRPWTTPQRDWLKRIAAQTKANILVDREALDDPDLLFKAKGGGFQRLDKLFEGQLLQTLEAFNDALWQAA